MWIVLGVIIFISLAGILKSILTANHTELQSMISHSEQKIKENLDYKIHQLEQEISTLKKVNYEPKEESTQV